MWKYNSEDSEVFHEEKNEKPLKTVRGTREFEKTRTTDVVKI